jgi:hypothetical protein
MTSARREDCTSACPHERELGVLTTKLDNIEHTLGLILSGMNEDKGRIRSLEDSRNKQAGIIIVLGILLGFIGSLVVPVAGYIAEKLSQR